MPLTSVFGDWRTLIQSVSLLAFARSSTHPWLRVPVQLHGGSGLGDEYTTTPEQRYMEYMQIMLTDTAVMHSFLAELDPAFVVCHDFDRIGDVDQASRVADHLAPNADVAQLLKASFVEMADAHNASTESLLYEGADAISRRLQRKFNAFETALCAAL